PDKSHGRTICPGPPHPRGRADRSRRGLVPKISPSRIFFLDQPQLPGSVPFLELALPAECRLARFMTLEPDEHFHAVALGKSRKHASTVLPHALHQVVCHSNVERAVRLAGENVDEESHAVRLRMLRHEPSMDNGESVFAQSAK